MRAVVQRVTEAAVRVDGQVVDLGDELVLDRSRAHDLDVVVDRVILKDGLKGRVTDSVELALKIGEGRLLVDPGEGGEPIWMSERFAFCGGSSPESSVDGNRS